MAITATLALPVAFNRPGNLGVSVFNSEISSIATPPVPVRIFDPQVEIAKDPQVEVEVKLPVR